LVAARDAKASRAIYAASSSAYGDTPTLPKSEVLASHAISPYAVSNLAGEYLHDFLLALLRSGERSLTTILPYFQSAGVDWTSETPIQTEIGILHSTNFTTSYS
jgi:UDP-glucose 4-epimerase